MYILCFDLTFNTKINHFLPSAYIAKKEGQQLGYVEKTANIQTINSCNLTISNDDQSLLDICDALSSDALSKKYNQKNKVKKPLETLLKEADFAKAFYHYIAFKLTVFLETCQKNKLPLSCNFQREIPFGVQQLVYAEMPLRAHLTFEKVPDQIRYTLRLQDNTLFYPSERAVSLLLNTPAWVSVDSKLYKLDTINSHKIAPFLRKQTIEIPERTSQKYFETFIKDMANKVEIDAIGFDMIQKSRVQKCWVEPFFHLFKNAYFFELCFEYEDASFAFSDPKKVCSTIQINEQISVIQTKRNADEEQQWIQKAADVGLTQNENKLFEPAAKSVKANKYATIQWLIENKQNIENQGFSMDELAIEKKEMSLDFGTISLKTTENEDWFDVQMHITCGEFVFPFVQIVPNIKLNDPFFELPNGQFFLIPHEWFSQYKGLVEMGKIQGSNLTIKKSQLPLLKELPGFDQEPQPTVSMGEFTPSKNLKATLRQYQMEGVQWLVDHHHNQLGACLADDMGLGKTLQTLALLLHVKDQLKPELSAETDDLFSKHVPQEVPLRTLVVAPSSLLFNWHNEAIKYAPTLRSVVYAGTNRKELQSKIAQYDLVFTSYPIVLKDIAFLENLSFRYVVVDESQYIKNKNSKIFQALNRLQTEHKITLSGTPIENSLDDLWSQMQFINPDLLGEYAFFVRYFKNPIQKNKDEKAIEELKKLIQPYILRRTKSQVAKDLPSLTEQVIYTEMLPEQQAWYEKEKSMVRNYVLSDNPSKNKLTVLNSLMKLRQLANHPKLIEANTDLESGKFADVVAYLETLLKAKQKVLLFSSFVKHLAIYTDWCIENNHSFCLLTGETSPETREHEVLEFQNNPDKHLFFISLKAGGVGLNLTAANYVVLLDPWWNPFAENQAIARAHRIGQHNQVHVARFIAKDSIEEKIRSLQDKKKGLAETIIDTDALSDEITENLAYLLA